MSSSDYFGGCLGMVAGGLLGYIFIGPLGALLGLLIFAVITGLYVASKERTSKGVSRGSVSSPVGTPAVDSVAKSPAAALQEITRLRDAGLISEAEYAAKRAQILERL